MLRIPCPWCGLRDHSEFVYVGDGTLTRPEPDAGFEPWYDFVYLRDNPRGPHVEVWHHVSGCRQHIQVRRDTLTHEITGAEPGRPQGTGRCAAPGSSEGGR